MVEKENCDTCQKRIKLNVNPLYCMKNYHSKQKSGVIWACSTCYQIKEQEFLTNYATIYFFYANDNFDMKTIKFADNDCYAGKKDQNGQILKQKDCQHCQPWRNSLKKTCANCGKDLSNQEMTYSSEGSNEEKKYWCSPECMNQKQNPSQNPKNNSEDKRMPTEMKVFLGILVVILVFIIGIALGKITQKNKNNKK